jgi:hypothetical protein
VARAHNLGDRKRQHRRETGEPLVLLELTVDVALIGGKADGQLVPETERPVVVTARHHEFDVELGPLRELLRHQSRGEFDRQALGISHGEKAYGKGDDP